MLLVVGGPLMWVEQMQLLLQAGFLADPKIWADASRMS
jgi:hypothetical protein